ncbi:MAG: methionyl-tRNA formyltransferase [Thermaurantiacus sp.]
MRLAFMGTPAFAVPALEALIAAGHEVVAVYTQPPRPAHRGRITASAVQVCAEQLGLDVRTPERLRDPTTQGAFAALGVDAAVVAAYGLILPAPILAAPRHGCINIHASLLPRWRGAAPIQRAILAGDRETGITIMQMERGLDTGPMLLTRRVAIGERETAGELTSRLATLGAQAIVEALDRLDALAAEPQAETGATYAPKLDKAETRIDWSRDAPALVRLVRAMAPTPGAWFQWQGDRVKLLMAEAQPGTSDAPPGTLLAGGLVMAGKDMLRLETVQPAGGRAMPAVDWLRGRGPRPGEMLG